MLIHQNTWLWGRTETIVVKDGAGICSVSIDNDDYSVAWIHGLSVLPAFRRQGLGRQLLETAQYRAGIMGAKVIFLKADPDSFVADWYRREGFKNEYTDEVGYIVMSKK